MTETPSTLADAREQLLALVDGVRARASSLLRAPERLGHGYAFVPALALGGAEDVKCVDKAKFREHVGLLSGLRGA